MDLGDRRGGNRFLLQLCENPPGRRPERLGYHLLHLLPRRQQARLVLEPGEPEMNYAGSRSRRVDSNWPNK